MVLNADIIYCIIKEFASSTAGNLEEWKLQLPLLCVSHSWRRIGLPIVYAQLYITCSKSGTQHDHTKTDELTDAMAPPSVVSNMDLVASLGFNSYAKTVNIVRACPMNLYDYISQAIIVFEKYESRWKHVSSLLFKTTPIVYPFNAESGRVEIHNIFTFERLNQLASCITAAMPNLVRVCTAQNNDTSLMAVVENRIVSTLACQIKRLNAKVFRYISASNFSRDLTCLRLTFVPASIQNIPKVCAPMLKQLELYGVFHSFSWNSFCNDSYTHCLEFSNLEMFCVHFVDGVDMLQSNISMRVILGNEFFKGFSFPKLQHFGINNTASSGTLLRHANFPQSLKYLEISLSSRDCARFWGIQFGNTERHGLADLHTNQASNTRSLDLANYLFGNELKCKSSELVLNDKTLVRDTGRVKWKHLRRLQIVAPLDLMKLLEIVSNLQHLESLFVDCLTFVPGMTVALDVDVRKGLILPLMPIITSIKTLYLKLGFKGSTEDICFMTVVRYLALRLTTLQQLRIGREYSDEVNKFVGIYNKTYPHLNSVVI